MEPVLTKKMLADYASLDLPKGRRRTGLFVAEGAKCVGELLGAFRCRTLYALPEWLAEHGDDIPAGTEVVEASRSLLRQITRLTTVPPVIAFFEHPADVFPADPVSVAQNLTVALDRVQDPGTLGTILRCCDWMGVHKVVASVGTADAFSPKAIQAAMGATARVSVAYCDLAEYIVSLPAGTPVYGTFLDGENIYTSPLSRGGLLVMGNEGNGISPEVAALTNRRLLIPTFPPDAEAVESLNVGIATAIALSQFRSRLF